MGRYKKEFRGLCEGRGPRQCLAYPRRTEDWMEELFSSSTRFCRMEPKHHYDALKDTKEEEGSDLEVSASKSSRKMKRKAGEGGSNDNASSASSFGLLAQGDGERAVKKAKSLLVTSQGSLKKCE